MLYVVYNSANVSSFRVGTTMFGNDGRFLRFSKYYFHMMSLKLEELKNEKRSHLFQSPYSTPRHRVLLGCTPIRHSQFPTTWSTIVASSVDQI